MSDITGYVSEYKSINLELKRRQESIRKLKKRKKEVESYILNYLQSTKYPGVKYQGTSFYKQLKNTKISKKKNEKIKECADLLAQYNIPQSNDLINKLVNTFTKKKDKQKPIIKMGSY